MDYDLVPSLMLYNFNNLIFLSEQYTTSHKLEFIYTFFEKLFQSGIDAIVTRVSKPIMEFFAVCVGGQNKVTWTYDMLF